MDWSAWATGTVYPLGGTRMLDVTFYGVRGSTPCSCDGTRGFGGNTSCVLIEAPDTEPIILDCGTGLRYLGCALDADSGVQPFRGTALVTHLHWDHVQGLPFFLPILKPGSKMRMVGPKQEGSSLQVEVESFIRPPLFPVDLEVLPGALEFVEMSAGSFDLGQVTVSVGDVPHVGATNGYRIDLGDASVAYLSDHQQPASGQDVPESVLQLCRDVDILIHDAQYGDDEFEAKRTWGHSTARYAAEVAMQSGAKRLVLFHHDPLHDDVWVQGAVDRTQKLVGDGLEVIGAREGLTLRSDG